MIEISLTPGPDALPGGMCPVHVTIRNDGPEVEIDNPAALLHLPRWRVTRLPDGVPQDLGNWQNFLPPEGQTPRIVLAPGASWEATVMLRLPARDIVPDEWEAILVIDTPAGDAESEPCVLRIQDWQIVAGHAGYGRSAEGNAEGDVLLLQGCEGGAMLYRMPWGEDESDRSGHGGEMPVPLQAVGADASDPLVPVRDAPFWRDPARWLLWREGAAIHAVDTVLRQQSLTFPAPPEAVLRPALQPEGGPIELAVLAAGRMRIDLTRFPRDADGTPSISGHIDLPMPVAGGVVGFAPEGGMLLGLSADSAGGVELLLRRAGTLQRAALAGATLVPNAPPALSVLYDGSAVVGALVLTSTGVAIARARFDGVTMEPVGVTQIGLVEGSIAEAALLLIAPHEPPAPDEDGHAHDDGAEPRAAVAVLRLEDGTLMSLTAEGTLSATTFEAPPVSPLTLAPGGHSAFILAYDPRLGPFMAEA
ncbi:MAG: hypothetical protein EXR07_06860 [Acetobacteraceae bacterium]|nr:hypothetical protein [Acetobacteraceae bacterium]